MMGKVKGILKHKQTELEALLETSDPKEQVSRIKLLMRPTLTLAITLDARSGQVSLTNVGVPIPTQIAYQMLDAARQALLEQERKAALEKAVSSGGPPAENKEPGGAETGGAGTAPVQGA